MSSIDPPRFGPQERATLLDLARRSIAHGLDHRRPLKVDPTHYRSPLADRLAAFVTLNRAGQLRGCIGHLEAMQPLIRDVADNAYAAAFEDPRFPPLTRAELIGLDVHISVLSPPEPMTFTSEADLLAQIRPGIDGLILSDGHARGTFLPSVWESLPDPRDFLSHLKRKAGLPADHWSDRVRVARYTTESFGD
jgi:AmmeMemoRadiSam system protein A